LDLDLTAMTAPEALAVIEGTPLTPRKLQRLLDSENGRPHGARASIVDALTRRQRGLDVQSLVKEGLPDGPMLLPKSVQWQMPMPPPPPARRRVPGPSAPSPARPDPDKPRIIWVTDGHGSVHDAEVLSEEPGLLVRIRSAERTELFVRHDRTGQKKNSWREIP
jgi:hypothetical protein